LTIKLSSLLFIVIIPPFDVHADMIKIIEIINLIFILFNLTI